MASVNVNFRMDKELKQEMERICEDMGMSMTTAFTIFAKRVTREHKIPFEVKSDPFYNESNMQHLSKIVSDINSGKAKFVEKTIDELEDMI